MKGTFFNKPLEYKIDIKGESWGQGSKVAGTLSISNHGTDEIDLSQIGCHLCFTNIKKLKAKDVKAFQLIDSILSPNKTLAAKLLNISPRTISRRLEKSE